MLTEQDFTEQDFTEQELQEALADAADDPAVEKFMLGLSDRALAEAGRGPRWRRPMPGRRSRWVPGIAVGTMFAVAATVGVVALDGPDGSGGGAPGSLRAPGALGNPLGQEAVTAFAAQCFGGHGPQLDHAYVWDPATQRYHGLEGTALTSFYPSPDGKQALVEVGEVDVTQSWAAGSWSDAVAGRVTPHAITGVSGVHWTADGKEIVSDLTWQTAENTGGVALKTKTADFYDPASGRLLASVPLPQEVLNRVASGKWSIQQFEGDHDAVLFPMLRADGNELDYLNAQGVTVRTLTLQEGEPANNGIPSARTETGEISPDGRYLMEMDGTVLAVFDLQAGGKRIEWADVTGHLSTGWIGDHQIATVVDKNEQLSGSRGEPFPLTGHSAVYSVLTPDLNVVQETTFLLPADPNGTCTTWPLSWAPVGQFPGAFVP
ncbi:hypothetical protein ABIA35_003236 [Catenulispora sp. MAP12-49]|uniref:hypothetical protein n=1 Tax=Catenulispora sp. MAP12-49 TaxID=3156302 RepID=UPI00351411C9